MSRKLSVGDTVQCRYYNTPERKFYGDRWTATISKVTAGSYHGAPNYYTVKREIGGVMVETKLARKEIKRRLYQ